MSPLAAYTLFHTIISLVGIGTGLIVLFDMRAGRTEPRQVQTFLWATVATSVTGFFFPFVQFTPAHAVGIVSLLVLSVTLYALYAQSLAGRWRTLYATSALIALYLNVFVLVVQLFRRVPFLNQLAPTQTEPPFAVTQALVLIGFGVLSVRAVRAFAAAAPPATASQRA